MKKGGLRAPKSYGFSEESRMLSEQCVCEGGWQAGKFNRRGGGETTVTPEGGWWVSFHRLVSMAVKLQTKGTHERQKSKNAESRCSRRSITEREKLCQPDSLGPYGLNRHLDHKELPQFFLGQNTYPSIAQCRASK